MSEQFRYIALLRGINVGGHKKIKMADLRALLSNHGYVDVKTVLASGNVALTSAETDATALSVTLAQIIEAQYGFTVPVILRRAGQIAALVTDDPFAGITVTAQTRLYVTFLGQNARPGALDLPYVSPEMDYRILRVTEGEVFSVLIVSKNGGTTKAMDVLEKTFGKDITTRNWNTVKKLVAI